MYSIKVLGPEHYIIYQIILKAQAISKYQTWLYILHTWALWAFQEVHLYLQTHRYTLCGLWGCELLDLPKISGIQWVIISGIWSGQRFLRFFKSDISVIVGGVKFFWDLSGQRFCLATVAAARPAPRPKKRDRKNTRNIKNCHTWTIFGEDKLEGDRGVDQVSVSRFQNVMFKNV